MAHELFFGGHVDAVVAGEAYGGAGDSEVDLGRTGFPDDVHQAPAGGSPDNDEKGILPQVRNQIRCDGGLFSCGNRTIDILKGTASIFRTACLELDMEFFVLSR